MKNIIKNIIYGLFCILVSPISISFIIIASLGRKDSAVAGYSQFLSLFPGQIGNYIRKSALASILVKCHKESVISFGVLFSQYQTEIHSGAYLGPNCNIGKCIIEKNCLLGSNVHIMSGKKQHDFSDQETPIKDQGGIFESITIGEDTWIGNGALVMANIGKKCIIGSGSVVTEDIDDFSIVAGNPAKIIKKRNAPKH